MQSGGSFPAGSGRALRLDPYALPVRFQAADSRADERVREVELHRERVVVRRAVRGMLMAMNLPVRNFRGVAIRMIPPDAEQPGSVAVMLEHHDAGLSVPLFQANDGQDLVAEWQSWSRVLGLPMLIVDPDGTLRQPFPTLGALRIEAVQPRRRRRGALKRRRPSILLRRKPGRLSDEPRLYRDEREIIARN